MPQGLKKSGKTKKNDKSQEKSDTIFFEKSLGKLGNFKQNLKYQILSV